MSLTRGYGKIRAAAPFDVIRTYGQVTFGASGAVTTDSDENGVWVFAKTATGKYTITTTEAYAELMSFSGTPVNTGTVTDAVWQIFTDYVVATKLVVLSHLIAGSAADPVSGDVHRFAIDFKVSDL